MNSALKGIPRQRKRLIEGALPVEATNRESAREKSIRHGHISTLHLLWAPSPHEWGYPMCYVYQNLSKFIKVYQSLSKI